MAGLTHAQLLVIKADVLATPAFVAAIAASDLGIITDAYNALASPSFTVWKTNVSVTEIGNNFNGSDLAGLTTANHSRLQTIAAYSEAGVNPSLSDRRAFFDDVFSGAGGTVTRAQLLVLWKRLATRFEQLLATGTGSDASPATLTFEGQCNNSIIDSAIHTS